MRIISDQSRLVCPCHLQPLKFQQATHLHDVFAREITAKDTIFKGKIESIGPIVLDQVTALGPIIGHRGVTASNSELANVEAEGPVCLEGTKVSGSITSSLHVECTDCESLGHVVANQDVSLRNCPSVGSVSGRGSLHLYRTVVKGDVLCAGGIEMRDSHVGGTLTTPGQEIFLKNSTVEAICVRRPPTPRPNRRFGQRVMVTEEDLQPLHVREGTILGDIVFESGVGTLSLGRKAALMGKVIGGTILS